MRRTHHKQPIAQKGIFIVQVLHVVQQQSVKRWRLDDSQGRWQLALQLLASHAVALSYFVRY
eukprot:1279388-Amphidinium_carterae.1